MRYHWGLAVGHVYTHGCQLVNSSFIWPSRSDVLSTQSTQHQASPSSSHREQSLPTNHSEKFPVPAPGGVDSADEEGSCEEEDGDSEPELDDSDSNADDGEELDENEELAFDEMYGET